MTSFDFFATPRRTRVWRGVARSGSPANAVFYDTAAAVAAHAIDRVTALKPTERIAKFGTRHAGQPVRYLLARDFGAVHARASASSHAPAIAGNVPKKVRDRIPRSAVGRLSVFGCLPVRRCYVTLDSVEHSSRRRR